MRLTFAALLVSVPVSAIAQQQHSDVFDQFFRYTEREHRAFFSELPGETIDPFTGTLRLVREDLVLPGKAGLDLRVVRSYSSKVWGRVDHLDESLLVEAEASVLGYGWTFHFGRLTNPNASGQSNQCSGDFPIFEEPDGTARVFYPIVGSDTVFVSRDFWRMEKNCGRPDDNRACVWSTSGVRYEFAEADQFSVGVTPVWPTAAIVDRFGNAISLTYLHATGAPETATDTYGRTISFSYVDVHGNPASTRTGLGLYLDEMIANGRAYHYEYVTHDATDTGGSGQALAGPRRFLHEVQPPADLPPERYEYAYNVPVSENQYALSEVVYGTGGATSYVYAPEVFFTGRDFVQFTVVLTRTVKDRGSVTLATWQYEYDSPGTGPDYHTTTITRPDGRQDVYTIVGFGRVAFEATSALRSTLGVGLVLKIARGVLPSDRTDVAETESFFYGVLPSPISEAIFTAPAYSENCGGWTWDDGVYVPVVESRWLQRDHALYTTHYSNFDDYAQPRSLTETGEQAAIGTQPPPPQVRTTSWNYFVAPTGPQSGTLNMVRGFPLYQQVCVEGECFLNSWTYDGPRFAMDSETRSGVTTRFGYDGDGNLSTVTNARNQTLTLSDYAYGVPRHLDFNGAFAVTRNASWEGWITDQTDGRNNRTDYDYDGVGRPTFVTPPGDNAQTVYDYGSDGTFVTVTHGTYTKTTYLDGLGREVQTVDSTGTRTSAHYDEMGRAWFRSYAYDDTIGEVGVKFEFDGLGRVKTQWDAYRPPPIDACETPNACKMTNEYLANCTTTSVERGENDIVTTLRCGVSFGDPKEARVAQVYDAAGGLWEYAYSAVGKLRHVAAPLPKANRNYQYDEKQFLYSETTPEIGTLVFGRNAVGQMTSRSDQRPVLVGYGYDDPLSRLRTVDYADPRDDVTRDYDESNNLEYLGSLNGGTYDYEYDELNRLRKQTWTYAGVPYVTTYHYDRSGCLDLIVYPTRTRVWTTLCDSAARPVHVVVEDPVREPWDLLFDVGYHPSGQVTGVTFGNGVTTQHGYDDRARVTSVSSAAIDLRFGYDGANNVKTYDDQAIPGALRTMTYDPLDRLSTATQSDGWGVLAYDYDAVGNRTWRTLNDISVRFDYGDDNRLVSASQEIRSASMTYSWDEANRMVASSDGATYRYDGHDRRVEKAEGALRTLYHHDAAGRVIAETLADGTKIRDYFYLGGKLIAVDGCVSSSPPGCAERQWYHADALGSVVARTDLTGLVVARLHFEPWGELRTHTGISGDRQYNGRVYDPGTGFHDYGARMYWPQIGRFISADTWAGDIQNPASLNRYSYVLNNPYKYVDPDGRNPVALMNLGNRVAQWCQSGGCQAAGNAALAAAAAVAAWAGFEILNEAKEAGQDKVTAPAPNDGVAKPHGGETHNDAIDKIIADLKADPSVKNVRKNQQQVDKAGNKVGTNRPDVQYDKNDCHNCVEVDTKPTTSTKHGDRIRANDPNTNVDLKILP